MEQSQFFTQLRRLFEQFPGIGPRQANRFIWTLLDLGPESQKELSNAILDISKQMHRCDVCMRVFPSQATSTTCSFCAPKSNRDKNKIMVLEHDSDLLNVEKTKLYSGLYHVLGGALDPMDEHGVVRERIKKLYERLEKKNSNIEIIFALSPTKLGEFTAQYVQKVLEPLLGGSTPKLKITHLARGLATGVELEYADEVTLRQALDNRK